MPVATKSGRRSALSRKSSRHTEVIRPSESAHGRRLQPAALHAVPIDFGTGAIVATSHDLITGLWAAGDVLLLSEELSDGPGEYEYGLMVRTDRGRVLTEITYIDDASGEVYLCRNPHIRQKTSELTGVSPNDIVSWRMVVGVYRHAPTGTGKDFVQPKPVADAQ